MPTVHEFYSEILRQMSLTLESPSIGFLDSMSDPRMKAHFEKISSRDPHFKEIHDAALKKMGVKPNPRILVPDNWGKSNILFDAVLDIEAAASRREYAISNPPFLALLPMRMINGMAINVPESQEILVAVDSFAFEYYSELSKTLARIVPSDGSEIRIIPGEESYQVWVQAAKAHPEALDDFSDFLVKWLRPRGQHIDASLMQPKRRTANWISDPWRSSLHLYLTWGAWYFIVGHEYGHILLGHLQRGESKVVMIGNDFPISGISQKWQQEFDADDRGAELAMGALLKAVPSNIGQVASAIDFCFAGNSHLEMLDAFLGKSGTPVGLFGSISHPPIKDRQARVLGGFKANFPSHEYEAARQYVWFFRNGVRAVFENIFEGCVTRLLGSPRATGSNDKSSEESGPDT